MYIAKKKIVLLSLLNLFFWSSITRSDDFVTIIAPADGSTVIGLPLSINGTSSQPNFRVRLKVNTTEIGSATTDGSGNWSFTLQDLYNGNYAITADLVSSAFEILATASNSFTVYNSETINFSTPAEDEIIFFNPSTALGTASLASTAVQLLLDNIIVTTTATDGNGNWLAPYSLTSNGTHTLLAQLMVSGNPVASASVDINGGIPVIFPAGKSQIRVIDGNIVTSGSGSGAGFIYSVSGSIITINFIPVFSSIPSVVATGQRSAGSSTVTIASASTTAASIAFSTGTQNIHFTAAAFQ